MSLKNRRGYIKISQELLEVLMDQPFILEKIFEKFYPINIEFEPFNKTFIYNGYSPEFDELEEDQSPLEYIFLIGNEKEVKIEKVTYV